MKSSKQSVAYCPSCNWEGHDTECEIKHFGDYCGDKNEPAEQWGWEEWDDLICPKCGHPVEFNDIIYN